MVDSRDQPDLETLSYKPPKDSILKVKMACYVCGWSGEVYECDCDADFPKEHIDDGRLRCPKCANVVQEVKPLTSAPPTTMGLNSAVIKPETRVNKAEDADQPLEQPKCRLCNDKKEIVRTFTGSIGLETAWRPKGSSTSREDEIRACPDCICTEQPNQNLMIIEEIEGLLSQVNSKISLHLPYCPLRVQALEEIDLFQKTTLFELRKAFE